MKNNNAGIDSDSINSGGYFTMPGESGYEELTLELARKWGADVIRDSDGTTLSGSLLEAGYGVYSTLCVIRGHNEWISRNKDKQQQCFLCTAPRVCTGDELRITLIEDFFSGQFEINPESLQLWQVYDRTDGCELSRSGWSYNADDGAVVIHGGRAWHKYTVSFMAYRVWEEISMYNHITNGWDTERLRQLDPVYPEVREYLKDWLEEWCISHPHTNVVRFTSLFYNFAWIWGSGENRSLFTDWASYDFTVSPEALRLFSARYGYSLTAEDFVNKGLYRQTHSLPDRRKLDWMAFVNDFVVSFGRELVKVVHRHGKKAYVFYDDSWVGMEPYGERFSRCGFDGIIKCVFSGFEARLCAGVQVETRELRLHPYLFPVGLCGAPTFSEGGDPTADARRYWVSVRRALLRCPVERIGLGGYPHLTEGYPEFVEYIAGLCGEFRSIRKLHQGGAPYTLKPKLAVLHAWGKLRSWTLSGHFHETREHVLIHVLESLSGLPFEVSFLSFDDISGGIPDGVDLLINAGDADTAWSGGSLWEDSAVVEAVTRWVHGGGVFLGIGAPSAVRGFDTYLRMAHVLGVDIDDGRYCCHGKWDFTADAPDGLIPDGAVVNAAQKTLLTNGKACVWAENGGLPVVTFNSFGRGAGLYMSDFSVSGANTRLLQNLILKASGLSVEQDYITSNPQTECALYTDSLAVINNSEDCQETSVKTPEGAVGLTLEPYEMRIITGKG